MHHMMDFHPIKCLELSLFHWLSKAQFSIDTSIMVHTRHGPVRYVSQSLIKERDRRKQGTRELYTTEAGKTRHERDAAWISKQSILSFLKLAMKTLYGVDLTWHIWTEKLRFYLGQMTKMLVGVTGVENKYIYFIFIWNIKTTDCRKWWHDAEGLPFPEKLPCSRCSRRSGTSPDPSHPLIQSSRE